MSPVTAAGRFFAGLSLGLGLGVIYGFLRPLRERRKNFADLLFLLVLLPAVVYFTFAICQGAPRLALLAAPALGGLLWEMTLGRLLRPLWAFFWGIVRWISSRFQKNFKKILKISKKLFASGKKSSTIRENDHPLDTYDTGGKPYDDP